MALKIEGTFILNNGLILNEIYARTNASLSISGDQVFAYPKYWISAQAYADKKDDLGISIDGDFSYKYDRLIDGTDILLFSNVKAKETLEALGFIVTILNLE